MTSWHGKYQNPAYQPEERCEQGFEVSNALEIQRIKSSAFSPEKRNNIRIREKTERKPTIKSVIQRLDPAYKITNPAKLLLWYQREGNESPVPMLNYIRSPLSINLSYSNPLLAHNACT